VPWENIKTSAAESLHLYKLKQHKPWYDEECLGFLQQTKQAKMQWLQHPNQSNIYNLNNVRYATRHFSNMEKEYLKSKIYELETNSKTKNIRDLHRGINNFKKGYQSRTNIILRCVIPVVC
jgi:hypothetical protein